MKLEQLAGAYRAKALPRIASIVGAAAIADAHALLTFDWPTDEASLDFRDDGGNTVLVMRDDLDEQAAAASVELRCAPFDADPFRVSRCVLGMGAAHGERLDAADPVFYQRHLEQLIRARYVLVVVIQELRLPVAAGAHGFTTGIVQGVALAIELAGLRVIGGFEFDAINTPQVRGHDATIDHRLRADLERQLGQAVRRGIATRFPSSTPPVTLGY